MFNLGMISQTRPQAAAAGWDISGASYASKSLDASSEGASPRTAIPSSDGTKMYIQNGATIDQYTLSTAWDLSSGSYASKAKDTTSEGSALGVMFGDSGTKMYTVTNAGDMVYQYTLSTAWDVSTASYASKSFSVTSQETIPVGLFFKPDGTKMFVVGVSSDTVYQYTLSTAWDVSTASYDSKFKSLSAEDSAPSGIYFSSDGTKMFQPGQSNSKVYQYTLSTAWDVSTASYDSIFYAVSEDSVLTGISFSSDGSIMYVTGSSNDTVYQYTL